jgi:hypothetical protein
VYVLICTIPGRGFAARPALATLWSFLNAARTSPPRRATNRWPCPAHDTSRRCEAETSVRSTRSSTTTIKAQRVLTMRPDISRIRDRPSHGWGMPAFSRRGTRGP